MPRPKRVKPEPHEKIALHHEGKDYVFEVWENGADAGTTGTHMRRKRGIVFDEALKHCESALAGNSPLGKIKIERLIHGQESLAAFGKVVTTVARTRGFKIGKTLAEEIAHAIRVHYKAVSTDLPEGIKK